MRVIAGWPWGRCGVGGDCRGVATRVGPGGAGSQRCSGGRRSSRQPYYGVTARSCRWSVGG